MIKSRTILNKLIHNFLVFCPDMLETIQEYRIYHNNTFMQDEKAIGEISSQVIWVG